MMKTSREIRIGKMMKIDRYDSILYPSPSEKVLFRGGGGGGINHREPGKSR